MTNPNPETADRELRDRIAEELAARFTADGSVSQGMRVIDPDDDGDPEPARAVRPLEAADAVLAVLPSVVRARVLHDAADRGAVLREAADIADETVPPDLPRSDRDQGRVDAAADIRKWADFVEVEAETRRLAAEQPTNTEGEGGCAHCGGPHGWDDCEAYTALVAEDAAQPAVAETLEPPTEEQTVRAHVLALHQIGEQLAGIESWMWERLADARDAGTRCECTHPEFRHRRQRPGWTREACLDCECVDYHVPVAVPPAVVEQPDTHRPSRGDEVEAWLKRQRDEYEMRSSREWRALDEVLDTYRLHADTGTPLDEHVCEARTVGDCDCLEQPDTQTPGIDGPLLYGAAEIETRPEFNVIPISAVADEDVEQPDTQTREAGHCDGCGHPAHTANECSVTRYGEPCGCDEPVATGAPQ